MNKIFKNRITLIIFFSVIFIVIVYMIYNALTWQSRIRSKTIAYPDSSAAGMARNFFEWYVSCNEEVEEEGEEEYESIDGTSECHRNTTYLSAALTDRLSEDKQKILCSQEITFHEIGIGKIIESENKTNVDIINLSTKKIVNRASLENSGAGWLITELNCIE